MEDTSIMMKIVFDALEERLHHSGMVFPDKDLVHVASYNVKHSLHLKLRYYLLFSENKLLYY